MIINMGAELKNNFKNLMRLDSIRIFKLIEISYYAIISFIITLFIANIVEDDKYMPYLFKSYDFEEASSAELLIDIIIDLVFLVSFIYYLKKLLMCIPFVFAPLNKKYIPSLKDEVSTGVNLGFGLILYTSLATISEKLKALDIKIKNNLDKLIKK